MITDSVIAGSSVVGWMTKVPVGMFAKEIKSSPPEFGVEFASRIACRSEPVPLSFAFKTKNIAGAMRLSSTSIPRE